MAHIVLVLYNKNISLIPTASPSYIFKETERWLLAAELANVNYLLFTPTYDLTLRVLFYRILKLPIVASSVTVKDILKFIRRDGFSTSSVTYNIKFFSEYLTAQSAVVVLEAIKQLARDRW
jgi:hypothetical protein